MIYVLRRILLLLFFILSTIKENEALRDVRLIIPPAVERGHRTTLKCFYNLEGDALYQVKWYKGEREFFRYTPKEIPPVKQFRINGLTVLESESNATHVTLAEVQIDNSGYYSCEISADAPAFFTQIKTGYLQVVISPVDDPKITGIKHRYRIGDFLKAECKSKYSKPATNLTWFVNGRDVAPIHIRHQKPHYLSNTSLYTSTSGLRLKITEDLFSAGRLKIRCVANLYNVYHRSFEISVEMERPKPRVYKTMTTPSTMGFSGVNVHHLDSETHATLIFAQPAAEVSSLTCKTNPRILQVIVLLAIIFSLR